MPTRREKFTAKFKEAFARFPTSFPEMKAVAELRPHSQLVFLHKCDSNGLQDDLNHNRLNNSREHLETIFHEATHWYDLLGTAWGQQYLIKLFRALDLLEHKPNEREGEFWKLMELYDEDRRINFPIYYQVHDAKAAPHNPHTPWRIQVSCGIEFAPDGRQDYSRPILFVKFLDHNSGAQVARQPISIGALLEATATASELFTGSQIIGSLSDDERKVEEKLWAKDKTTPLYDPRLTNYTAATHFLSSKVKIGDPLQSYDYAAALAQACLQLTPPHFTLLKHPSEFLAFSKDRLDAFIARHDRGYAFCALACHAPSYDKYASRNEWLDATLAAAGLPDFTKILKDARSFIRELGSNEVTGRLSATLAYLKTLGIDAFDAREGINDAKLTLATLSKAPLPGMYDENGQFFYLGRTPFDQTKWNPEEMFEREYKLQAFTQNFLQGCRGLV